MTCITWTNAKYFNVIGSGIMFGVTSWKRNGEENPFVLDFMIQQKSNKMQMWDDLNFEALVIRRWWLSLPCEKLLVWHPLYRSSPLAFPFAAFSPMIRIHSEQFRIGRLHIHDHEFENRRISQNDTMMLFKNSPATLPNFHHSFLLVGCRGVSRMKKSFNSASEKN
jgi:hypothetical protein